MTGERDSGVAGRPWRSRTTKWRRLGPWATPGRGFRSEGLPWTGRRYRRYRRGLPVLVGLMAAAMAEGAVSPGVASASTGAQVVTVTGTATLEQVACPSATLCVAVGSEPPSPSSVFDQGVVVPLSVSSTGAVTAGLPLVASDFGAVSNVACPNQGNCVIAGYGPAGQEMTASVAVSTSGTLTLGPSMLGATEQQDVGFACASSTCIGVSYYGTFPREAEVYLISPTGEVTAGTLLPANFGAISLACASATVCVAANSGGSVLPLVVSAAGITVGTPQSFASSGGPVACLSATLCVAAVSPLSGNELVPLGISGSGVITVGTAPPPEAAPGPLPGASGAGSTLACATSEVCESLSFSEPSAVTQSSVATSGGAADGTSLTVPGAGVLDALACPSAATCLIVGSNSSAFNQSGIVASLQVPYPSVAPTSGSSAGSVWTDITGSNLSPGGASCVFYDFSACIVYDSPTLIVVLSPAEPAGTVEVTVKGIAGSSTPIGEYTYT
jgi:IPT/TIG domain